MKNPFTSKHWIKQGIKAGPGGLECPCCNPYGKDPKGKKKTKRTARRKAKQELKAND